MSWLSATDAYARDRRPARAGTTRAQLAPSNNVIDAAALSGMASTIDPKNFDTLMGDAIEAADLNAVRRYIAAGVKVEFDSHYYCSIVGRIYMSNRQRWRFDALKGTNAAMILEREGRKYQYAPTACDKRFVLDAIEAIEDYSTLMDGTDEIYIPRNIPQATIWAVRPEHASHFYTPGEIQRFQPLVERDRKLRKILEEIVAHTPAWDRAYFPSYAYRLIRAGDYEVALWLLDHYEATKDQTDQAWKGGADANRRRAQNWYPAADYDATSRFLAFLEVSKTFLTNEMEGGAQGPSFSDSTVKQVDLVLDLCELRNGYNFDPNAPMSSEEYAQWPQGLKSAYKDTPRSLEEASRNWRREPHYVKQRWIKMYQILASYPGVDLNRRIYEGGTVLHWLAARGYPGVIIRDLIDRGADPAIRNARGKTAADIAALNMYGGRSDSQQGRDLIAAFTDPTYIGRPKVTRRCSPSSR